MPTPNVGQLLAHPQIRAAIERALAAKGVHGDSIIAHLDPREAAMLKMMGGVGTVNPRTGLRQFYGGNADPDAGGVGGSTGRSTDSSGNTSGSNPGGYGHASDSGGGYGPLGIVGDIPGAIGNAISGIGGFLDRASGNFGQGWGSRGVAGGYGGAGNQSGAGYAGGGAGGGGLSGGHSGQNYYSQTYGGLPPPAGQIPQVAPLPQAPVINNLPQAPVSLTPMMSSTATSDLAGGERFGALPSWATQPYQVGTAPSAYPTPGINAGLGAPGYAGNPLPGQPGGSGLPGGGGGLPGGGGVPGGGAGGVPGGGSAPSGPVAGPYVGLSHLAASGQGALANRLAPPPGSPQDYWAQMLASGQVKPSPALQALYTAIGRQPGAPQQPPPVASGSPRNTGTIAGPAASPAAPGMFQRIAQQQGVAQARPGGLLGGGAAPKPAAPAARPAAAPAKPFARTPAAQPARQPATMTAAARAAAAAKAQAAAKAKARPAARTGGKNFG